MNRDAAPTVDHVLLREHRVRDTGLKEVAELLERNADCIDRGMPRRQPRQLRQLLLLRVVCTARSKRMSRPATASEGTQPACRQAAAPVAARCVEEIRPLLSPKTTVKNTTTTNTNTNTKEQEQEQEGVLAVHRRSRQAPGRPRCGPDAAVRWGIQLDRCSTLLHRAGFGTTGVQGYRGTGVQVPLYPCVF